MSLKRIPPEGRMTCIELYWMIVLLWGGATGFAIGLERGGALEAVGGALLGAVAGPLAGTLPVAALVACLELSERRQWRRALEPIFGRFWRRTDDWRTARARWRPGARVSGRLVAHLQQSAVVDVGVGFPVVAPFWSFVGSFERAAERRAIEIGTTIELFAADTEERGFRRHSLAATFDEPAWIRVGGAVVAHAPADAELATVGESRRVTALRTDAGRDFAQRLRRGETFEAEIVFPAPALAVARVTAKGTPHGLEVVAVAPARA